MNRLAAVLLCCLAVLAHGAEPEVRVQSRLVPAGSAMVGGTVNLEVDLLVETWFTAAPVLPKLDLPGTVVTPPGGEAQHLSETQDGKAFTGLRFVYQIIPQVAERFEIPALVFQVQPGQGSGPVNVQSQPQRFVAKALAGGSADAQHLVARTVTFTQDIERSHEPLRQGDSVTRRLRIEAEGAQAMSIPPPPFVEVEGLKRYVQPPKVMPLSDGRGGSAGGARDDSATYVVGEAGRLVLPAIELRWWDAETGEARSVSVPEVEVEAVEGGGYQVPFSVSEDLRALGQTARVTISGHWLLLVAVLALVSVLAYFGRPWARLVRERLRHWKAARRQAWLNSAGYAWKLARQQASKRPAQLGGLYLWVRRSTGNLTLFSLRPLFPDTFTDRLLAFFNARYARRPQVDEAAPELSALLPEMRQKVGRHKASKSRRHGLKSLNT